MGDVEKEEEKRKRGRFTCDSARRAAEGTCGCEAENGEGDEGGELDTHFESGG